MADVGDVKPKCAWHRDEAQCYDEVQSGAGGVVAIERGAA